jgi:2,4-diketo-3-deoxy-L-fuconate hydrolase
MKLFRFGAFEQEKPGVELSDGAQIDVSAIMKNSSQQMV